MEKLHPAIRWAALALAAGALAFAFVWHRPDPDSNVDLVTTPPPATASPVANLVAPAPLPTDLAVYVCGAVRRAGVYHLPAGSRVVDAVDRAGGLGNDADPEAINLATPLVDGMKIDVLKKGALPQFSSSPLGVAEVPRSAGRHRASGRSSSHKLSAGQTLDINTAGESELVQLPGVGPSLARRIVEYRQSNGPFQTLDDLENVSGIGPSKLAKMEPFLTL